MGPKTFLCCIQIFPTISQDINQKFLIFKRFETKKNLVKLQFTWIKDLKDKFIEYLATLCRFFLNLAYDVTLSHDIST